MSKIKSVSKGNIFMPYLTSINILKLLQSITYSIHFISIFLPKRIETHSLRI